MLYLDLETVNMLVVCMLMTSLLELVLKINCYQCILHGSDFPKMHCTPVMMGFNLLQHQLTPISNNDTDVKK